MIRTGLIKRLQTKLQDKFSDRKIAKKVVDETLELFMQELRKGNRIEVRGFGTFSHKDLPARNSRNPRTGEEFWLKERKTIHFKPGKKLKADVAASKTQGSTKADR